MLHESRHKTDSPEASRAFLEKSFYNDKNYSDQEHQHGNLVDPVHHAQIEVGLPIWVFLAEKIAKNRSQVEVLS
jgi:hypothetical protein